MSDAPLLNPDGRVCRFLDRGDGAVASFVILAVIVLVIVGTVVVAAHLGRIGDQP